MALDSRSIPAAMLRDDAILTHPVFNRYHSETEMMRYMHATERKDLALNRGDDPAGFLHHETERRGGDDPDHRRNSPSCTRSARSSRRKGISR